MLRESHLTFKFSGSENYTTTTSSVKSTAIGLGHMFDGAGVVKAYSGTYKGYIPESENSVKWCGFRLRVYCVTPVASGGAITVKLYTKAVNDNTNNDVEIADYIIPADDVESGLIYETVLPEEVKNDVTVGVAQATTAGSVVRLELVPNV